MTQFERVVSTIDSHTAGECTRLVMSGLPPIPGETMADRLAYAETHLSWAPGFLLLEPRGHKDMFGAIITPPCAPEADIGVLFMDNRGYEPMCGHATIGTATTLLETGVFAATAPETVITLDTPSGLVRAHASVESGRVTSVSFQNVPAFVYRLGVAIQVPDIGTVTVDVVFAGLFFVLVEARQLEVELFARNASQLADLGMRILTTSNEEITVHHPDLPHLDRIMDLRLYEHLEPGHFASTCDVWKSAGSRNVVILGDGMVDRSPCGTGTSAEAALRHARGTLGVGDSFVSESIIGSRLTAEIVDATTVGQGDEAFPAVVTRVTGSAYITGFHRFVLDPDDPFPQGFRLDPLVEEIDNAEYPHSGS